MTQKLLFLLAFLFSFIGGLTAQTPVWWGYWNSSMPLQSSALLNDGTTHTALRVTAADCPQLSGATLHGLRFYISDKTAVRQAWVWVSATQFTGATPQPDKLLKEIDLGTLKDVTHDQQPTEISLDEPVALMASGRYANAYVGVTLRLEGSAPSPCRLMSAGGATRVNANSCLIGWNQQEALYGPLAFQLLVTSDHIPAQGMAVQALDEPLLLAGEDYTAHVVLKNDGSMPVHNFDLQLSIDGSVADVQHIELDSHVNELGFSVSHPLHIALPATAHLADWQVSVTSVNGQPNLSQTSQASSQMTLLSQWPLRRTVMEELTGTWCPNCPRGLVGMRLLEELFGDRFVGIAVHGGDSNEPMRLPEYDGSAFVRGVSSRMGGRPSCSVDRTIDCDPYGGVSGVYQFEADAVVSYLLEQPTVADLAVSAHWTSEARTAISFDVATTFRYSTDEAPFSLMLVLTADSLTGEGNDWLQVNTLVGKTEYSGDLDEFVYGERYMRLKYNHVPVYVSGVEMGIEGSITAPLVCDEAQHYQTVVDITGNRLIQSKDYLHAIALLIDTRTGQVANAAKTRPVTASDDIRRPSSPEQATTRWYSLDGRRLSARPVHGLFIEQTTDKTGNQRSVLRR